MSRAPWGVEVPRAPLHDSGPPVKWLLRVLLSVVFLTALLGFAPRASAQSAPNHPGFAFGTPAGEALFVLGVGLTNASSALPQVDTGWGPDAPHDHNKVIDRVSDITGAYGGSSLAILSGYALEVAYFGDAGSRGGGVYALHGALVDLESAALSRGVVDALKRLTGRCRPRYFQAGQCTTKLRDAFPSGHTTPLAAIAGARLFTSLNTTGPSTFRWTNFGIAETLAVTTALLRVQAGMHSWTDVGAGLLLGHALGLFVAAVHPMQRVDPYDYPQETSQSGFALTWSGSF